MDISSIGKSLIFFGACLLIIGSVLFFTGRSGIDIMKLPGDIVVKKEGFTLYFPLATSIILSLILTFFVNMVLRK